MLIFSTPPTEPEIAAAVGTGTNAAEPLSSTVDKIMARVHVTGLEWAAALEAKKPGHQHGMRKFADHVQPMVAELPGLCIQYGLTDEMSQLARVVFGSHDIGRPVEALERLKGVVFPTATAHGKLSVTALREKNALDGLDVRQKFLVEFAIEYHCVLRLPPNIEIDAQIGSIGLCGDIEVLRNEAVGLCYFLRDRDKVEILSKGPDYLTPEFVAKELDTWYFGEQKHLGRAALFSPGDRADPEFQQVVRHALDTLLLQPVGTPIPESGIAGGKFDQAVFAILNPLMTGGIHPTTRQTFLAADRCDKSFIGHSWSTYMLYAAAFAFDVKHAATAREIGERNLLGTWLGYVAKCVPPGEFTEYKSCLDRYLASIAAP